MRIKTNRHVRWLLVIDEFNKRIGKTKLGIGIFTFGCNPWVTDKRIIGAKNKRHGVKQKKFFRHIAVIETTGEPLRFAVLNNVAKVGFTLLRQIKKAA
jgi:hypothetical protein